MNNPRIDKLLNGCGIRNTNTFPCSRIYGLCPSCKAELLGILGQMKCEVGFLESFDWTISRDACVEGKHKTVYMGFIEHFGFIQEDQENKIKIIKDKIEELNSDIKRIEEMLK